MSCRVRFVSSKCVGVCFLDVAIVRFVSSKCVGVCFLDVAIASKLSKTHPHPKTWTKKPNTNLVSSYYFVRVLSFFVLRLLLSGSRVRLGSVCVCVMPCHPGSMLMQGSIFVGIFLGGVFVCFGGGGVRCVCVFV